MRMRTLFAAGGIMLAFGTPMKSAAQDRAKPEILILGTHHMANPGRDLYNVEVDDVLSATRQREIAELIEVLSRFRPTKVAVEASVVSRRTADRYQAYVAGEDTLTRNEIDQIGFRLAHRLGLPTVHAVDEGGDFPYYRVQNYAKANGRQASFDSIGAATGVRVERAAEYLRTHTVLEALVRANTDSSVAEDVGGYYAYVPFGEPWEYAGPDLLASWFQRNVRIYRNVHALIESPDERVLVVYGAGHLGWLRQMVEDDPSVRLRTLSDLVSGQETGGRTR